MTNGMLALFGLTGAGGLLLLTALVIAWAMLTGRLAWPKNIDKNLLALFIVAATIASAPLWILVGPSFVAVAPFLSRAQCTALKIFAFPAAIFVSFAYGGVHPSSAVLAALPLVNGLTWGLMIERLVSVLSGKKSPG
jgi:hypothetical protein